MRPSKELNLSCTGRKPFNDPIDLVWFVTGCTNLCHNHITVQASVQGNASFGPNQTMLLKGQITTRLVSQVFLQTFRGVPVKKTPCIILHLAMVEPMASPSSSDDALKLICFHPDDLVHPLIAPQFQTLPTQLHRPMLCKFESKNHKSAILPAGHPKNINWECVSMNICICIMSD